MLESLRKYSGLKYSLNDPQWGRSPKEDDQQNKGGKKPEQTPDIEQLWLDFNRRVARFLKRGKGGGGDDGGSGGFRPQIPGARVAVPVLAAATLLVWLLSGVFSVLQGQVGVVTTFGKFSRLADAGVNWSWPSPIQHYKIVDTSLMRTVEVGYRADSTTRVPHEALMLTADDNILDVQVAIDYRVNDPAAWLFHNVDAESAVRDLAESTVRGQIGKNKFEAILYGNRDEMTNTVLKTLQETLDRYKTGVKVMKVTMQTVRPPEEVRSSFDDVVKAGQDRDRMKNEGQTYANSILPVARGDALKLQQDAEGYRTKVVATAEGDAIRFRQVLAEYQKAPGVTRDRMYIDAMQEVFTHSTKVLVDAKGVNNLTLPLGHLVPSGDAQQENEAGTAKQTIVQSSPAPAKDGASTSAAPATPAQIPSSAAATDTPVKDDHAKNASGADPEDRRTRDPLELRSRETR